MLAKQIQDLQDRLAQAHKIVFFGGAGVSTESGIPDFRSADGIFDQVSGCRYTPEEVISHDFAHRQPQIFFDFYFDKLVYPDAAPNLAHTFLKGLEDRGKELTVITQNIDGLHQKAGSSRVYELHGSVLRNYCLSCGRKYSLDQAMALRDIQGIPQCPQDGGIVRPDVVLYQEGLDPEVLSQSIQAISRADLLIVAGTSLAVYPAAGLIGYFQGDHLVTINKSPLQTGAGSLRIQAAIHTVFDKIDLEAL